MTLIWPNRRCARGFGRSPRRCARRNGNKRQASRVDVADQWSQREDFGHPQPQVSELISKRKEELKCIQLLQPVRFCQVTQRNGRRRSQPCYAWCARRRNGWPPPMCWLKTEQPKVVLSCLHLPSKDL